MRYSGNPYSDSSSTLRPLAFSPRGWSGKMENSHALRNSKRRVTDEASFKPFANDFRDRVFPQVKMSALPPCQWYESRSSVSVYFRRLVPKVADNCSTDKSFQTAGVI
ncbi:unnamed protein product [Ixodes pacificus]